MFRHLPTIIGISVFLLLPVSPASAQSSFTLAEQMGDLLASESLCGLQYDQSAIEQFISQRVKPDDLSFTSNLAMMTRGSKRELSELTPSAKTAHCSQTTRVARSFGFIK